MERFPLREQLSSLSDPDLVELARQPCVEQAAAMEHLVQKYRPLVEHRARRYFVTGGDQDDLMQEGFIGLYQAIHTFDPRLSVSFARLAATCVQRRMISAVRRATASARQPTLPPASLEHPISPHEENGRTLAERLPDPHSPDPEASVQARERAAQLFSRLQATASSLEWDCLVGAVDGYGTTELADRLEQPRKTVANALYRARRKARSILEQADLSGA